LRWPLRIDLPDHILRIDLPDHILRIDLPDHILRIDLPDHICAVKIPPIDGSAVLAIGPSKVGMMMDVLQWSSSVKFWPMIFGVSAGGLVPS